ncbi:MAG: PP2C family protein-serine/threonine phosphatase [Acidobacteriaceae bacterium]
MRLRNAFQLPLLFTCLLFLLSLSTGRLRAQIFNTQTGRENITSLDGLWRFHTGDNPAWADPNFDDSQWPLLRSDETWARQGYKSYSGYAWYRFQIFVPPGEGDLSLSLPPILTSYQLFVDGRLAKTVGRMPPDGTGTMALPTLVPLQVAPSQGPRSITIALRVWHWPGWSNYQGGGPQWGGGLVGQSLLLQRQTELSHDSRLLASGGDYTLALVEGIAGLLGLLLFLIRRTEWEYLWFAGNALSNAATFAFFIYCRLVPVAIIARDWVNNVLILASALFFIAFLVTLLRARRTVLLYLAIAASLAMFLSYALLQFGLFYAGWMSLTDAILYAVILVWAADLLIRKSRAGLPDARLLLAPVLFALTLNPVETALWGTYQLGWQKTVTNPSLNLFTRPFAFTMDDATEFLFLLAMLAILINRFARTRREEQRLAGELEAARSMQSLLVPATLPVTPGFTVESVYLPASEVGGDFFQVLPGEDGSLLVVVGDVSGKGLKAAMTVSAIVGALRDYPTRRPAEILAHLNRVLHGQISGFVTCCAALIAPGGVMTLANAGHLAPYRNGEELAVESGLPLGIVAEGSYGETDYQLAPGDRLTFMSDGVVEARNTKGELYGFERAQQVSSRPAATIAETAKQFGQEDDITVVGIQYGPPRVEDASGVQAHAAADI